MSDRRRYHPLFTVDPAMGIKIGRLLDNIFQNLCNNLVEFAFDRDPLRRARKKLEFMMDNRVSRFFEDIWGRVVPTVLLPRLLTSISLFHSQMTDDSSKSSRNPSSKKAAAAAIAGVEGAVNKEADPTCQLPKNKSLGTSSRP